MTSKVVRLTQSQRSARTREKLIRAAIDALHRFGYAATSTTIVAEMAGVSRGAMLHQFPSKVELMFAVAKSTFQDDLEAYRSALSVKSEGREKLMALFDTAWQRFRAPGGVAQTEIWMATRSDAELAALIVPLRERMTAETQVAQANLFASAGMTDAALSDAMMYVNVAAFRGLALERALGADEAVIERAIAQLRVFMAQTIEAR